MCLMFSQSLCLFLCYVYFSESFCFSHRNKFIGDLRLLVACSNFEPILANICVHLNIACGFFNVSQCALRTYCPEEIFCLSFQMIVKYDLVAAYLKREKEHQGDQLVIKIKLRQQKILSMRILAAFQ